MLFSHDNELFNYHYNDKTKLLFFMMMPVFLGSQDNKTMFNKRYEACVNVTVPCLETFSYCPSRQHGKYHPY